MIGCRKITAGVLLVGLFLTGAVQAGICDAVFLHNGGQVIYTGSGSVSLGADLSFDEVQRTSAQDCRARVRGVATFAYAGLPPGKSKLDYLMTIKNGQARFVRYELAGERPNTDGQFDLRILGLFAYDRITGAGQRFPGANYRLNLGKEAPVGGQPSTTIRIGEKKVGAKRDIATAMGKQSCWPVRYTRASDPTTASFKGLILPIPGLSTSVTDWYCPATSLVMRQEIDLAGNQSVVEITQVK